MGEVIDFIIGAPPVNPSDGENGISGPQRSQVIVNGMPLVHIQPGTPNFEAGLDLMSRDPAFSSVASQEDGAISGNDVSRSKSRLSYLANLAKLGYTLKQPNPAKTNYLSCAFLADSFPTDTFTNEYGENFLQGLTNVASEGMAGLSQLMGARKFTDLIKTGSEALKKAGGGGPVTTAVEAFEGGRADLARLADQAGPTVGRIVDNANILAAGGRIDFPMLWKNSTYSPSYTMTIRLYNPNPGSLRATDKYIIGPIAALLLLGLPQSVGEGAYSWPYIHQFWAPGIYNLDPGYISNITVVKGGDQQQISWKQRMGVVDVRLDFGSVFNSILSNASDSRNRPTLKGYLNAMKDEKSEVYGLTDTERINNEENQSPSVLETTKSVSRNSTNPTNKEKITHSERLSRQRKDSGPEQEKTQLDITEPGEVIRARVPADIKTVADILKGQNPPGITVTF